MPTHRSHSIASVVQEVAVQDGKRQRGSSMMRILHIEDDPHDAELIQLAIKRDWPQAGVTWVSSRDAATRELQSQAYDLVLSDVSMPSFDGSEALRLTKQLCPDLPFIFLSGTVGEERAIESVQQGADDYVLKDRLNRLRMVIPRALDAAAERRRRRQAEALSRDLTDALNQAREAVVVTDLTGAVTFWNKGAELITGRSAPDVLGRTERDLFDRETRNRLAALCKRAGGSGDWVGELELNGADEVMRTVELRVTPIRDADGRPKARLIIGTDVSERKQLQEQFLRAQRMENLGLLATGIAHDLNNMLAPILLATPMLRDQVMEASGQKLLDTLEKSAERGAQLVRQILSFAHGVGSEHHVLQVKHLLRDVVAVIHGTFPKSIRLEDYVPSDLWPVSGNPTQIHQVLINLCVNARDAMPDGGVMAVRGSNRTLSAAEAAEITGARPGAFLVIEVSDSGTGIAPELLKRIWEPFFTTKEAGRGTGLGLSTVRGIVQAHRGFTQVESKVGEGSTFRVFLPAVTTPPAEGTATEARALPRGHGELILVVDDEQQIRETISQMLSIHGYRVLLACDGAEATALFAQRATEIRLVISDLHMPNLDGAMFGRALRQINPDAKLLVVSGMASGLGNRVDFRPDEFADALLLKPFKVETILELVQQLLEDGSRKPFVVR